MASISRFAFARHLRAEPNQFILHFKAGRLVRRGAGIAYWFNPISAAVAQLPVEDCETTFMLRERSSDFQEVSVQCTVTFRVSDPETAAARVNFGISLATGVWLEEPLERLAAFWSQRAQQPARRYLTGVPITQAVRSGADDVRNAVTEALKSDAAIGEMGLALVGVQISQVSPTAELEKALQTPTRESLQQKADEAVFQRRALAVEKERAIKENEMATELELARQQEKLIEQRGANQLLEIQRQAQTERARAVAEAERLSIASETYARDALTRARGDADAKRAIAEVDFDAESKRVAMWQQVPNRVLIGLSLQKLAGNIPDIQHLNITPDLVGEGITALLRSQAES